MFERTCYPELVPAGRRLRKKEGVRLLGRYHVVGEIQAADGTMIAASFGGR